VIGGGVYPSLSGGATRRLPGVVISFTNYLLCFCYIFSCKTRSTK
jgi:hypothetical protein